LVVTILDILSGVTLPMLYHLNLDQNLWKCGVNGNG